MASSTGVKRKLSGSTDGKPILIAASGSPGTTIHTAVAGTTPGTYDELWLWAYTESAGGAGGGGTTENRLYLEFGDTAAENVAIFNIPVKGGLFPVCLGLILQNSLVVSGYGSTANDITVMGFVNSMTD